METWIILVLGCIIFCAPCVFRGRTIRQEVLTWSEAKQRIKKNLTLEKFDKICESCSWKDYGICEKVITKFLDQLNDGGEILC